MFRAFVCCAVALTLTTGCARDRLIGREGLAVVRQGELPIPDREDLILTQRDYVIGPLDKLSIDVYGVSELSRQVQTDLSGRVSMPLVGSIDAAGKSPGELAVLIAERLRGRYVRDPRVTVNLTETVSQTVTVDGQVNTPGAIQAAGRMTLMRAVARAGGLAEFADQNYVVIFRTVNDQQMAGLYDLRSIRQGVYPDPEVFANDIVLVGETYGRRLFRDVLQGSGLLAAPLVTLLQ